MVTHLKPIIADSDHSISISLEILDCIECVNIALNECMVSSGTVSITFSTIHILDAYDLGLPPAALIALPITSSSKAVSMEEKTGKKVT